MAPALGGDGAAPQDQVRPQRLLSEAPSGLQEPQPQSGPSVPVPNPSSHLLKSSSPLNTLITT